MIVAMKVARSALPVIPLAHWERAGVRETVTPAATYILWGGADAMAVSPATGQAGLSCGATRADDLRSRHQQEAAGGSAAILQEEPPEQGD